MCPSERLLCIARFQSCLVVGGSGRLRVSENIGSPRLARKQANADRRASKGWLEPVDSFEGGRCKCGISVQPSRPEFRFAACLRGDRRVVGDNDHGKAPVRQPAHQRKDFDSLLGVQCARRFVCKHYASAVHERPGDGHKRPGDGHTLLFSAGKFRAKMIHAVPEPHRRKTIRRWPHARGGGSNCATDALWKTLGPWQPMHR